MRKVRTCLRCEHKSKASVAHLMTVDNRLTMDLCLNCLAITVDKIVLEYDGKASNEKCQGCIGRNAYFILDCGVGLAYRLCGKCLLDLINLRLTPKRYFNLVKDRNKLPHTGDGKEFYLNGDFYDPDTGKALQPHR